MPACHREYKSSLKINFYLDAKKRWDVVGFLVVRKVRIGFRYFIRPTFQARPFHGLRIAITAKNHLLTANHDYDVANLGSQMTSDGNLRRGRTSAHGRVVPNKVGPPGIGGEAGGRCRTHGVAGRLPRARQDLTHAMFPELRSVRCKGRLNRYLGGSPRRR